MGHIDKKRVVRILNTLEGILLLGVMLTSYYGWDGYLDETVGLILLCLLAIIISVIDHTLEHILGALGLIIISLGFILTAICGLEDFVFLVGIELASLLGIIISVIGDEKYKKLRIAFWVLMMLLAIYYLLH